MLTYTEASSNFGGATYSTSSFNTAACRFAERDSRTAAYSAASSDTTADAYRFAASYSSPPALVGSKGRRSSAFAALRRDKQTAATVGLQQGLRI